MKRKLTIVSAVASYGIIALLFSGLLNEYLVDPVEVEGRKITGKQLYDDFMAYEILTVEVDVDSHPATFKVYGENGTTITDITKHFEPTKPHPVKKFNLTPLQSVGHDSEAKPDSTVEFYYLLPKRVRKGILFKRYMSMDINAKENESIPRLKAFNPVPPGPPSPIFGDFGIE